MKGGATVPAVTAVVFAADELVHGRPPTATESQLRSVVRQIATTHPVWTELDALPAIGHDRRGTVLVVGSRASASMRMANAYGLCGVLIAPDPGSALPAGLEEAPDFVLSSLEEVPQLIRRIERDEADFQGVD